MDVFVKVKFPSGGATAATPGPLAMCQGGADAWKAAYNKRSADTLASMYGRAMYGRAATYSNDAWAATGRDALLAAFKQEVAGVPRRPASPASMPRAVATCW